MKLYLNFCAFFFILLRLSVFGQTALTVDLLNGQATNLIPSFPYPIEDLDISSEEHYATRNKVFAFNENNEDIYSSFCVKKYDVNLDSPDAYIIFANNYDVSYQSTIVNQETGAVYSCASNNNIPNNGYDIYLHTVGESSVIREQINTINTSGHQVNPVMAIDYARKELVVAWQDQGGNDGSGYGIYARRIDYTKIEQGSSMFIGDEFRLNNYTSNHQILSDIAFNAVTSELYIVAEYFNGPGGTDYDVFFKRMNRNSNGTFNLSSDETLVNTSLSTGVQKRPKLTINNTTGSYLISWQTEYWDCVAKVYNKYGAIVKSDFFVNTPGDPRYYAPRPIWDEASGITVFFYTYDYSDYNTIRYQIFDNKFNKIGTEGEAISEMNTYSQGYLFNVSYNQITKKIFLAWDDNYDGYFRQFTFSALSSPSLPSITNTQNNTRSVNVRVPITNPNDINNLNSSQVSLTTTYSDGLGRPMQQVCYQTSPAGNDLVQQNKYDNYGRQPNNYQTYATDAPNGAYRPNAATEQSAFYNNNAVNNVDGIPNDTKPYSSTTYEPSPLNRTTQSNSSGSDWNSKPVTTTERPNLATDQVRNWVLDPVTGSLSSAVGSYYPDNSLTVVTTVDEDNGTKVTYTNKKGQKVLEQTFLNSTTPLSTYHVFDDFGNLRYTIPPEAVNNINTNSRTSITYGDATFTDKHLYAYLYDHRQRMIERKIPGRVAVNGSSAEFLIYDRANRSVLKQTPAMRQAKKWSFVKYDNLNRIVYSGIFFPNTDITRTAMQSNVDNGTHTQEIHEKRSTSATNHYYTNTCYPTTALDIEAVNYYDTYDITGDGGHDFSYNYSDLPYDGQIIYPRYNLSNFIISNKIKIYGTSPAAYLTTVYFYDKYGRQIQTQSNNYLNQNTAPLPDVVNTVYDFEGKVLRTRQVHNANVGSKVTIVNKRYDYDNSGRAIRNWQQNTNRTGGQDYKDPEVLVSEFKFNEIGKPIEKNLHSENGGTSFLQSLDYTYNIRGWLTHINNSRLGDSKYQGSTYLDNNDDVNDLFGMELLYQNQRTGIGNTVKYDGNASAMLWNTRTPSGIQEKAYKYLYDGAKRLFVGEYGENISTTWTFGLKMYENTYYDLNGNLTYLERYDASGSLIDGLNYEYANGGNVLTGVSDISSNIAGFKDGGSGGANEMRYNADGSLIADDNKGITITYNDLGLTEKVTYSTGSINYIYDGQGKKLAKILKNTAGTELNAMYYINGFQYSSLNAGAKTLQFFGHEEGRCIPSTSGISFTYEYIIEDHLGNARVRFDKDLATGNARILQEDTYYPFGLTSSYVWVGPKNQYLQNGKELQEDGFGGVAFAMYDYAARMYDATIGRFVSMDPLADADASFSPYAFCGDNPANFFDPDGLAKKKWNWKKIIKIAAIVIVAVAVVAVIASVPVLVCPGTALAKFVGIGAKAHTLGAIAGNMLAAAGKAVIAGGSSLGGAIATGLQAVGVKVGFVLGAAAIGAVNLFAGRGKHPASGTATGGLVTPFPDGTVPNSGDCGCGKDVGNPLDGSRKWDFNGDGKLQYNEAVWHYWTGNGAPITVDASLVNLSSVNKHILDNSNTANINILWSDFTGEGTTYGQLELTKVNGVISISPNDFDFEVGGQKHPWTGGQFWRNVITFMVDPGISGVIGTPFRINFVGQPKLE